MPLCSLVLCDLLASNFGVRNLTVRLLLKSNGKMNLVLNETASVFLPSCIFLFHLFVIIIMIIGQMLIMTLNAEQVFLILIKGIKYLYILANFAHIFLSKQQMTGIQLPNIIK